MTERIALFVDVQNIYYTTRQTFGCHFNYQAFWDQLTAGREVVRAVAYAIDRGDAAQMNFQRILHNIGFEVRLKPFIQRRDGSAKGDWDVGIALDAMEYAKGADVVVLASGDGDFDLLVDKIRHDFNAVVEVYGVPKFTSTSLINSASKYVPIDQGLLLAAPKR